MANPAKAVPPSLGRAEEAFRAGKLDIAKALYGAALANAFITPKDRALALCRKGLISSMKGGFNEALQPLESSLRDNLLPAETHGTCSFALLQILVLQGKSTEAVALLDGLGEPKLTPQYQARAWALGAESARKAGNTEREVVYLQRLMMLMDSAGINAVPLRILGRRVVSRTEVQKRLGIASAPAAAPALAPAASTTQTEPSGSAADRVQKLTSFLAQTLSETRRGSWAAADQKWQMIETRNLMEPTAQLTGFAPPVAAIRARLNHLQKGDPRSLRIGVLVPADTALAPLTHRIMRSVSAFLASPGVKGAVVTTHVRAVAADPGAVEGAALDLVLKENVSVIVGPIASALVWGAIPVAETFGVPLFALGPVAEGAAQSNPMVVRMGVLADSQTSNLAAQAKEAGLNNIAILAPNDAYGVEMARSMARAAQAVALPMERTTYYEAGSDVFRDGVQAALGPQSPESRPDDFKEAIAEARQLAASQKRKFDPAAVKLPARVRFDGIFVPDTLQRARVIASTFAFFEARGLRFLGDRQWATTENRRSMADDFILGARVPVLMAGRYSKHLAANLGLPPLEGDFLQGSLDLERQVFDALLLARQGQYLANGLNGFEMIRGLKEKTWKLDGTSQISGVTPTGEPRTDFGMRAFRSPGLTPDLPVWTGEGWQESLASWAKGAATPPKAKTP
jgi:ABC-type branched-subunit amino acid transport system substrate-binding protein